MGATTRVQLHCHSTFSDGALTPEQLAAHLAADETKYASLTDHDTVEGLPRFRAALERHNIGFITGVELTVQHGDKEIHLLGYGFDPSCAELLETLRSLRQGRDAGRTSVSDVLRRIGTQQTNGGPSAPSAAPCGRISADDAISLLHRAKGKVFLAHPLMAESDLAALEGLVGELAAAGLDGIEAIYASYSAETQTLLCDLAAKNGLRVCAGTDFHGTGDEPCGIDMPTLLWRGFRSALFEGTAFESNAPDGNAPAGEMGGATRAQRIPHRIRRTAFFLRIVFPAVLAMMLFSASIWLVILPAFERALIDRKREMIRELTNSAWSILAEYEREVESGELKREQAQQLAKSRVEHLRYGKDGKDYFWLQDMHPRIVMHPYRPDLNGQDVSDFTDPRGARIFVEFAELVRRQGEGYIQYVWQWKDDRTRLAPKESYVKGFEPWGWVIGTGLYIEDVKAETARIESKVVNISLILSGIVALLLFYVVQQSRHIERKRQEAEKDLQDSHERYRSLVEATTEGQLLTLDGRCSYANPRLLEMLGYTMRQLALLDLEDLLPRSGRNQRLWEALDRPVDGEPNGAPRLNGVVRRADGTWIDCEVLINPITVAGRSGSILLITEANAPREGVPPVRNRQWQTDRELALANLRSSLAFLHEPVGQFVQRALRCALNTPVHRVAALMTARGVRAALVEAEGGEVIGIATDSDLRARVLARERDSRAAVHTVMSAPLITVSDKTPVYEVLLRMEEHGVAHLAVADERGMVTGLVHNRDLLPFHRYGASVLAREISRSTCPEAVAEQCRRVAGVVETLVEGGARARNVTRMISSVCDAATARFVALAIDQIGPPPVPFVFLALGSQGRMEQTLFTDQDNAIVYLLSGDGGDMQIAESYLGQLGTLVCHWLDESGYALCRGQTMAQNARWCRPVEDWKAYFETWIRAAAPQQLLEFSIFFDFRTVYGPVEPALSLRRHIHELLRDAPDFFPHLAQQALEFKPPYRLFGKIFVPGGSAEHGGGLNLKDAMMPIVSFARLYALRHEIEETHTLDRLDALAETEALSAGSHEELVDAYEFLMRLRLRHQLQLLQAGQPLDNTVPLRTLGHGERAMLKEVFAQIAAIQKRISYDFLGGT